MPSNQNLLPGAPPPSSRPRPLPLPLLGQKRGGAGPLQPFRSRHRRPSNDDWRSVWAVLGKGLPRLGGTSARRRGGFLWSAPLTVLGSGGLRPFLRRPRPGGQSLSARQPARLYRLCAGTDRPHLSPVLSSRANRVEALRSGGGFGTRPGAAGGPSPLQARMGGGGRSGLGCSV